jgi:hypothetical protein
MKFDEGHSFSFFILTLLSKDKRKINRKVNRPFIFPLYSVPVENKNRSCKGPAAGGPGHRKEGIRAARKKEI